MIIDNIQEIYRTYFNTPYTIESKVEPAQTNRFGTPIYDQYLGRQVMLPVTLRFGGKSIKIVCCTVRVIGSKTIVKTALSERAGTFKELFTIGDWEFTVKGVLIGEGRSLPDDDMYLLKQAFETSEPLELSNAVADLFLDTGNYVVMENLEFLEVEGRSPQHRPFSMTLVSDNIHELIL